MYQEKPDALAYESEEPFGSPGNHDIARHMYLRLQDAER